MQQDVRHTIRQKIEELKEQIRNYETTLETLDEIYGEEQEQIFELTPEDKPKRKLTLKMKTEAVLKETQEPLTSRQLMNVINQRYPEKKYKFGQFSGQFSVIYRRKNSNIRNYEIPDAPPKFKVFYGLKSWFSGNDLKQEYKDKITKRIE